LTKSGRNRSTMVRTDVLDLSLMHRHAVEKVGRPYAPPVGLIWSKFHFQIDINIVWAIVSSPRDHATRRLLFSKAHLKYGWKRVPAWSRTKGEFLEILTVEAGLVTLNRHTPPSS